MIVRKHFRFTGRVQGVGFRYRAKYAANGMGITGWAKNEFDGSVEMEVHETGRVYDADLEDISQRQEQLWDGVQKILTQLSKLS